MPSVKSRALLKTLRENREELTAAVLTLEKSVVALRDMAEEKDPLPQTTARMMVGELEIARRMVLKIRQREMDLSEILADIGMPLDFDAEEVREAS